MSGEGASPPAVLDEQTRALIESLIQTGIQAAITARPTDPPGAHAGPSDAGGGPVASGDAVADPPIPGARAGAGRAGGAQAGGTATDPGDSPGDGSSENSGAGRGDEIGDSDGDSEAADQAFTARWYEARRGDYIPPRFGIPERFDPRYPVGFEAESVAHYRTFCTGAASAGREAEANALYANAAYLTEVTNALTGTVRRLRALESRVPAALLERLRDCRWEVSDAQLALFGVYELTASRYEILCGREGARGVADPALLESFIDAPAAYSTTGREAFRRQQEQAIRNAARIAGRRNRSGSSRVSGATTSVGASTGGSASAPTGPSRTRGRGGRGGRVSRGRGAGRGASGTSGAGGATH
jgi:hypothetical protein